MTDTPRAGETWERVRDGAVGTVTGTCKRAVRWEASLEWCRAPLRVFLLEFRRVSDGRAT